MAAWKNEDDIKRELRVLTDELKQLREELRAMVAPPKLNPTRAFLHRQSWPGLSPARGLVVGSADERKRPGGRRRPDMGTPDWTSKPDKNDKDR